LGDSQVFELEELDEVTAVVIPPKEPKPRLTRDASPERKDLPDSAGIQAIVLSISCLF
jgi:hypothetical protein